MVYIFFLTNIAVISKEGDASNRCVSNKSYETENIIGAFVDRDVNRKLDYDYVIIHK